MTINIKYNIRNIIRCVTNDNIKYVLGNRDLNKIKVYHLTTLNGQNNKFINDFVEAWNIVMNAGIF